MYGCWNCKRAIACMFCGSFSLLAGVRTPQRARAMLTDILCQNCGHVFEHRPSQTRIRSCSNVAETFQRPEPPEPPLPRTG